MTKKILQHPNKVLRKKSEAISDFNSTELQDILKDMFEALETQDDGVALAAPQIGISKRIFVISPVIEKLKEGKFKDEFKTVFINPEIVKKSNDSKKMEEGCLSIRYKYGNTKRSSRVRIKAYDEDGNLFESEGTGLVAQIFQHEIEHLDGILFIDSAIDIRDLDDDEIAKINKRNEK